MMSAGVSGTSQARIARKRYWSSPDHGSTFGMSSQPPKDFLALSHGEEWVNFYESFDKLVQDHLSRSSELLRKAMSLPEVADREVAQVRTELEGQLAQTKTELEDQLSQTRTELEGTLAAERQQHQAALNSLKAEISSSHQQAASLARMFGSLLTDLDRLSSTVDSALTAQAEAVAVPAAKPVSFEQAEVAEASATAEESTESSEAPVAEASTESTEWSAEAVSEDSGESDSEAGEGEALSGESQSEIDLNALAAAETESTEETSDVESHVAAADESKVTEASSDESDSGFTPHVEPERPRPHWLSVARSNSSH
jgi:DNA polymerase III gamma/tau subunit